MGRDKRNAPALDKVLCNQLVSELEVMSTTLNQAVSTCQWIQITIFSYHKKMMFGNYWQD